MGRAFETREDPLTGASGWVRQRFLASRLRCATQPDLNRRKRRERSSRAEPRANRKMNLHLWESGELAKITLTSLLCCLRFLLFQRDCGSAALRRCQKRLAHPFGLVFSEVLLSESKPEAPARGSPVHVHERAESMSRAKRSETKRNETKRNETKRSQASKPGVFCETKPSLKSSGRPNEHRKPMRAAVAKRSQASPFPIGSKGFRVKWVGYFGPLRCELNRRHGSRVPDPSHPVFADRIGKCSLTDRLARAGLVTLGKHQGGQRLAALGLDQQKGFRPLGRYGDSCDGGPRRGFQRRSGRGPLRSARERRPRR